MPDLVYGTSSLDRERGNFPALPVINMFAEQVPTEKGVSLQSRPGLEESAFTMGAGPVKALYQIDGVLGNNLFGISNTNLYSYGTEIGPIDGDSHAVIAGYETNVFATAGDSLWGWDGTTLSAIAFPDGASVIDICVGASRLIAIRADTGKFYWSDTLSTTIDDLSFATAENSPDKLKACLYLGDTLILFGSETVEFWPVFDDADNPFQPLVGRTFQVGIRDTGCATLFSSTFAWVTDDNQIAVSNPETIISDSGLEAKIEASEVARLWSFHLEGVEFLAVTLDTETWVFSSRSKQWSQFESYDETNWLPRCSVGSYFGSSTDGKILQWSADHLDLNGPLERRFRAGAATDEEVIKVNNLRLRTNPGQTPYLTGDYSDPTIEIRTSGDGGHEWSEWRQRLLGEQGRYRTRIEWLSLGYFSYPGFLVEFRVTDPVPFRVSNVVINASYPGV